MDLLELFVDVLALVVEIGVGLFAAGARQRQGGGEGINAFGGSWFAVSPSGNQVAPGSQPQGGGGYGSGY